MAAITVAPGTTAPIPAVMQGDGTVMVSHPTPIFSYPWTTAPGTFQSPLKCPELPTWMTGQLWPRGQGA